MKISSTKFTATLFVAFAFMLAMCHGALSGVNIRIVEADGADDALFSGGYSLVISVPGDYEIGSNAIVTAIEDANDNNAQALISAEGGKIKVSTSIASSVEGGLKLSAAEFDFMSSISLSAADLTIEQQEAGVSSDNTLEILVDSVNSLSIFSSGKVEVGSNNGITFGDVDVDDNLEINVGGDIMQADEGNFTIGGSLTFTSAENVDLTGIFQTVYIDGILGQDVGLSSNSSLEVFMISGDSLPGNLTLTAEDDLSLHSVSIGGDASFTSNDGNINCFGSQNITGSTEFVGKNVVCASLINLNYFEGLVSVRGDNVALSASNTLVLGQIAVEDLLVFVEDSLNSTEAIEVSGHLKVTILSSQRGTIDLDKNNILGTNLTISDNDCAANITYAFIRSVNQDPIYVVYDACFTDNILLDIPNAILPPIDDPTKTITYTGDAKLTFEGDSFTAVYRLVVMGSLTITGGPNAVLKFTNPDNVLKHFILDFALEIELVTRGNFTFDVTGMIMGDASVTVRGGVFTSGGSLKVGATLGLNVEGGNVALMDHDNEIGSIDLGTTNGAVGIRNAAPMSLAAPGGSFAALELKLVLGASLTLGDFSASGDVAIECSGPVGQSSGSSLSGSRPVAFSGACDASFDQVNDAAGEFQFSMAGAVAINGVMGSLSISGGAVLKGTGRALGRLSAASGTISFGSSPGVFTLANGMSIGSGATYVQEFVSAVPGTGFDQAVVIGPVIIDNTVLSFDVAVADMPVGQYIIIDNDGIDPVEGSFINYPQGADVSALFGTNAYITYTGGDGNDVAIVVADNDDIKGNTDEASDDDEDDKIAGGTIGGFFGVLFLLIIVIGIAVAVYILVIKRDGGSGGVKSWWKDEQMKDVEKDTKPQSNNKDVDSDDDMHPL